MYRLEPERTILSIGILERKKNQIRKGRIEEEEGQKRKRQSRKGRIRVSAKG
jgi:uncharacterized membrane protein YdbT with pleckstrin-like domain